MKFKENLHEIIFEAIREGLILVDNNGKIIEINPPGLEMFGYKKGELIQQPIEILVPSKARNVHKAHRHDYNHHPTTRLMGANLKLDGVRKDGSEFPVQVSLNPFTNKRGEQYTIALVSNVTSRRENEIKLQKLRESLEQKVKERTEELNRSEQLYKSIARNFPSGVISIFDQSYKYLFAEGQGLFDLGLETTDLIGINYLERIDPEVKDTVKNELDNVFQGSPRNFEISVGERTYQINSVPLTNDEGVVNKILVVEQNITAQKEVAKKLQDNLNKEKELTELKSRFVSMASHEFRTPLTTINSSASLIQKHLEKENYDRIPKHTDRIKNAVHNLTSILNDFLSFEKLEADKVNVQFVEYNIPEIISETFDEMTDITKPHQELIYQGPEELIIHTDSQLVKNTILNLLSNAVKYSYEDGKIIVRLVKQKKGIQISIQDFGMGIPEKDQKNLFTRFYRAGNVTNIEGTGLGLNIVLRYLHLLEGDISFESKEGKGTTFLITLPLK